MRVAKRSDLGRRNKTLGSHAGSLYVSVGVQPKASSNHEWGNNGTKQGSLELAGIERKLLAEPKGKASGRTGARRGGSAGARTKTGVKTGEGRGSAGTRLKAGERAGVSRGRKGARAKAGKRAAARRALAAPRGGRTAGARGKQRTAAQRAPGPAPQGSTPQALPASGAGPAPPQATHRRGGVAHAGRESAAAHAGSARALAPAQPAAAPESGYAEGFRDGVFAGGEALVAQHIPPDHILPTVAAADLIEAGFRQYAPTLTRLASPHEMAGHIQGALDAQRPLSVVRLGDGELLTLAADTVLPGEQVQGLAPFLPYAGVPRSTPDIRAALAEAIRGADWVGVPISRAPTFQGLLFPVLRHFGIDWSRLNLTSSTINYSLHHSGLLLPVVQGRRVLLIGSQAAELGALLNGRGIQVTGIIGTVEGVADIPRVMQQTAEHSFDIALVAAGIPAVILCRRIAGELGRVAIDFGHLADKLVTGELHL
ncbi:GT-D fold domain-containing glycosyltransferase [Paenibacillus sp. BIC5C1]|uniref:GT-D fold domain-containing protein n=1 Tax=Paenibacillus sp. BIC5C1 TaxID=3078263 RepID=UPI0028ED1480|nr:GT-D fold domain-containing glycosyltransferase [Paenibacillus sp. BIC5C1]